MKKQYKILILSYFIPFFLIITVTMVSIFSIQYLKDFQVKSQKSLFLWKRLTSTAQLRFYFNGNISDDEWNESLIDFEKSLNELEQDLNPIIFSQNIPLLEESYELWLFTKDLLVESNNKYERLKDTELGLILSGITFQDLVLNAYYEDNKDLFVSDYYPFHLLSELNADLLIILNYISSDKLFENKLVELSVAISDTVDFSVKVLIIVLIAFCFIIVLSAVLFIREYQADLHRNEDHLSLILNSIGDAMIVVSANSIIQKMNPIAQYLTGCSLNGAKGKDLYDVFNIYEPLSGAKSEDLVEQVIKTKAIINSLDKRLLRLGDREFRYISISAAPVVNSDTTIEAVVLIFRDISKRKKQEEEIDQLRIYLSNIIDSMPSALVGIDGEKKISLWNKTVKEQTGFNSDQVYGKKLNQILPDFSDELETIDDSMKNNKIVVERRKPRIINEKKIYEDITIYPLQSDRDEGAVIRIDDVTERVQIEEVLVQNEKMLSLGGLAAGMAHEINNPLSAIIQTSNIMEERLTGTSTISNQKAAEELGISMDKIRDYMEQRKIPWMLKSMKESGIRAAAIVENMLSFARKSDQSLSTHSAEEIIESTLLIAQTEYDLKKHFDFKSIKLIKNYPYEDLMFVCDKSKIQQVLLNIFSNGSQAMYEASIPNPQFNITITKHYAEGKEKIRIDIEDNGPGMDDTIRKQVFDPFFTTKTSGKGTGLGLSISYFIITETHKGEIFVDSILGKGTTFTILLPLEV